MASKLLAEEDMKKLAREVVKYQYFQSKIILDNLEKEFSFKRETLRNYVDYGIAYIQRGKETGVIPKRYYGCLHSAIASGIEPLIPNEFEKRQGYRLEYGKKNKKVSVENIVYGVTNNNIIKTFNNKQSAVLFANAIKPFCNDIKTVYISISEVINEQE